MEYIELLNSKTTLFGAIDTLLASIQTAIADAATTTADITYEIGSNLATVVGLINADGTYSDFKGKARLMTDDDYALDINDDGTSTEIAVTTEGGSLRLVKD